MPAPDKDIISQLNDILRNKLTGINQYFLHARMLKHMGQLTLADYTYKSSIDSMKFSDMLVEHILTLGGKPNLQELGALAIGETPEEMLANDCAHAEMALTLVDKAAEYCAKAEQKNTVELLKRIAVTQAEHVASLRAQLSSQQTIKDCA